MQKMTLDEINRYSKVYVRMLGVGQSIHELKIVGGESIMNEAKNKIYFANLVKMVIESNQDKNQETILNDIYIGLKNSTLKSNKTALYETIKKAYNCESGNKMQDAKFKLICEKVQYDAIQSTLTR